MFAHDAPKRRPGVPMAASVRPARAAVRSAGAAHALMLQRAAGNRATRAWLASVAIQRIFVPQPKRAAPSVAASRAAERFIALDDVMKRWLHTYTKQTTDAVFGLKSSMAGRETDLENLQLGPDAESRMHAVTDRYVEQLKAELAKNPQDTPNQEGSVLGIWRLWDTAFTNQLGTEQLRQSATAPVEPQQPGDYPQPDNPLDQPDKKDEGGSGSG
jgi:hypothetical protein